MDDLLAAPACPSCGTVLVDGRGGLECRSCDVVVEVHVDVVMSAKFDGSAIHDGSRYASSR